MEFSEGTTGATPEITPNFLLLHQCGGHDTPIIVKMTAERAGRVIMHTVFGGRRIVDMLVGEQLARIC